MANNYSAEIEWRDITSVIPYGQNAKQHPEDQILKIASSIAEFGFDQPIVVDADGVIIKGHGRRQGALKLGLKQVPVIVRTDLTPTQVKASRLADNRVSQSGWDNDLLSLEMGQLFEEDYDLKLTGFDPGEIANLFGIDLEGEAADQGGEEDKKGNLASRFGIPPFTVMSAREGWWQDRKRAWIDLGIRSELGRGAAPGGAPMPLDRQGGGGQQTRRPEGR